MCEFGVQTTLDLPRAEHLLDDELAIASDDDLSIEGRLHRLL